MTKKADRTETRECTINIPTTGDTSNDEQIPEDDGGIPNNESEIPPPLAEEDNKITGNVTFDTNTRNKVISLLSLLILLLIVLALLTYKKYRDSIATAYERMDDAISKHLTEIEKDSEKQLGK